MGRKVFLAFAMGSAMILGIFLWQTPGRSPEAIEPEQEATNITSDHKPSAQSPLYDRNPGIAIEEKREESPEEITEDLLDAANPTPKRHPHTASAALDSKSTVQDPQPLLVMDEIKFQTWLETYQSLDGLGFLHVISDMKRPSAKENACIQGTYQTPTPMPDGSDPLTAVAIALDICLGESALHRTNKAELTIEEGSTIRQPGTSPSSGGLPGGFRLVQHEGQSFILVRSAQDVFQFFFLGKSDQVRAIWYKLDANLVLTRKGSFVLTKISEAEEK